MKLFEDTLKNKMENMMEEIDGSELAKKGLEVINRAANTAQENFRWQQQQVQWQLSQYLAQHRLTLEKVNTAIAILNHESKEAGLTGLLVSWTLVTSPSLPLVPTQPLY
jgi:hypothetical protein